MDLPDLDGYDVVRRLKSLPQAPLIICLTVHGDRLSKQRCQAAGGDGFVEKSKGWSALIEQIQEVLANC